MTRNAPRRAWSRPMWWRLALAVVVAIGGFGPTLAADPRPPSSPPSPQAADTRTREVTAAFHALRDAFRVGDGPAVLALLSADTRERLKVIHGAARRRVTIDPPRLTPSEKLMAGALERALTPTDLRRHDLGDVLTRALKRPGTVRRDAAAMDVGGVTVHGDTARATLFVKGAPTMIPMDFTLENGRWRLDLAGAAKAGDMVLAGLAGLKGVTTDALIDGILSRMARGLSKAG